MADETFQNFHLDALQLLTGLITPSFLGLLFKLPNMLIGRALDLVEPCFTEPELSLSSESGGVGSALSVGVASTPAPPLPRKWGKRKAFSIGEGVFPITAPPLGVEGGVISGVSTPVSLAPQAKVLSRWRSRMEWEAAGGETLTDRRDPGRLLGTKTISFGLEIHARGAPCSNSLLVEERSNAPLSSRSAMVHSDITLSWDDEDAGVAEAGPERTKERSVYGCIRNGAARSIPAASACPISRGVGYANEQRKDSMLCISLAREIVGCREGGMRWTRCARLGINGTGGMLNVPLIGECVFV